MSTQANFAPNEWTALLLAPIEAGAAVMLSGKSGLVGTAQEMLALYKSTNQSVAQRYPGNRLIQSLLSEENKEARAAVTKKVSSIVTDKAARQNIKNEAIQIAQEVSSILAQKASPQEAEGYKKWVMDVSGQVAGAASEEGEKLSPPERATMQDIARALNVMPS